MRGYELGWREWRLRRSKLRIPMRGYEKFLIAEAIGGPGYESPWGVMSKNTSNPVLVYSSYESPWGVMSNNSLPSLVLAFLVTNPHEGLWVFQLLKPVLSHQKLRIPMRGYETQDTILSVPSEYVTNPHEGLWVPLVLLSTDQVAPLRIPMRGYEKSPPKIG